MCMFVYGSCLHECNALNMNSSLMSFVQGKFVHAAVGQSLLAGGAEAPSCIVDIVICNDSC